MSKQIREVRVVDIITHAVLPPVIAAALWLPSMFILYSKISHGWALVAVLALISYPLLGRFLIGLVLVYKAFAPMEVREQCRFYPTCSSYMIMAIQRYGAIIGVLKGICRIFRCKPPNGGEDYP